MRSAQIELPHPQNAEEYSDGIDHPRQQLADSAITLRRFSNKSPLAEKRLGFARCGRAISHTSEGKLVVPAAQSRKDDRKTARGGVDAIPPREHEQSPYSHRPTGSRALKKKISISRQRHRRTTVSTVGSESGTRNSLPTFMRRGNASQRGRP